MRSLHIKQFGLLFAVALFATLTFSNGVSAGYSRDALPEVDGIYDVEGRPNEKLRVHVYHPKKENEKRDARSGKPSPQPTTLSCAPSASADPDSVAQTGATGWTLPATWTYALNMSSVPSTVGAGNLPTIVQNSFASWTSTSPDLASAVSFVRGADTTVSRAVRDNANIITFGRTSGSALAVTYTWYNTATGKAIEIDTIFNKSFPWYWSSPATWPADMVCAYQNVYDAQNILTHEFGHSIGLEDEYDAPYINNTMYGYGAMGETKKNSATTGDLIGLSLIY